MEKNLQLLVKLINKDEIYPTKLHQNVLGILFENRRYMRSVYNDIRGLYGINHFSLSLKSPTEEQVFFSTTPSIEYNLISKKLWVFDEAYYNRVFQTTNVAWWNETDSKEKERIEKIRLADNNFTLGMTINRYVDEHVLRYSFATSIVSMNLREYYLSNLSSLIDIGDYCYKLLRSVYLQYCGQSTPPEMYSLNSKFYLTNSKQYLRLIVNNIK
jgi:hypothetical protein